MNALLDTHAFLWFVLDDPKLSGSAKAFTSDPANEFFVSPASYWEIAIKISIRKYSLSSPFATFWQKGMTDNGFRVLPIEVRHAAVVASMPFHHRDPLDRLLIAQALVEQLAIVSDDAALDAYGVRRIW